MEFLGRAGSYIGGNVGFGSDQAAEMHEFVNTKLIALGGVEAGGHAALPEVVRTRTRAGLADAIAPVVSVGEAATGPTKIGSANPLHVVDKLLADSIYVRDLRIPAYPDTVVDNAAQVLDEVSVNMRADERAGFGG